MIAVRVEGQVGESLTSTGQQMLDLAAKLGINVVCEMNGVDVLVRPNSTLEEVGLYYNLMQSASSWVGPANAGEEQ